MMEQFRENYLNKFDINFIGQIACVAHIINLIINDIMSILKLKAAPSDEIAIFINDMEKLAKKKGSKTVTDEPGKLFLF